MGLFREKTGATDQISIFIKNFTIITYRLAHQVLDFAFFQLTYRFPIWTGDFSVFSDFEAF